MHQGNLNISMLASGRTLGGQPVGAIHKNQSLFPLNELYYRSTG